MPDDSGDQLLLSALGAIQSRGPIGTQPLTDAVAHSDRFVSLLPVNAGSLVDLGSGGGLPGLVIAWRRPQLAVTLVERRIGRADQLRRAASALGLGYVTVAAIEAAALVRTGERFDVVTARSFGSVAVTLQAIDALLVDDGVGLVSEPPADRGAAWIDALRHHPMLRDAGVDQGIRRIQRSHGST